VTMSADEALAATAGGDDGGTLTEEATEFFRDVLGRGETLVEDIESEARAAGLLGASQRIGHNKALRKARESLGIISRREGFGPGARYYLRLAGSPCAPANPHVRPLSGEGAHGAHGVEGGREAPELPAEDPWHIPEACRRPVNGRSPAGGPIGPCAVGPGGPEDDVGHLQ
jgi:hypothetical protein